MNVKCERLCVSVFCNFFVLVFLEHPWSLVQFIITSASQLSFSHSVIAVEPFPSCSLTWHFREGQSLVLPFGICSVFASEEWSCSSNSTAAESLVSQVVMLSALVIRLCLRKWRTV